jgi:hypothetical protein
MSGQRTWRRRLAAACAGALLAALVLEGVARFLGRTDELFRARMLHHEDYWISRWLALRDPDGTGARHGVLSPGDALHRRDPVLGWVPAASVREDGVSTNSLGLRGTAEVALEKKPGERRLVVCGDSFTFGSGVRDEDVWTEVLAGKLEDVTVLNLGVMGYGLDQECLRFEQLGSKLSPDVVLLGLYGPDIERIELSFRDDAKPRFVLAGDGLELTNVPVPTEEELLARIRAPSATSYAWALLAKGLASRRERSPAAPKWELARRILDRLRTSTEEVGARLVVVYFPAGPQSAGRAPGPDETTVVGWTRDRGVPLIDLREAFVAFGPERSAELWRGHWTPLGNRVVAEAVHAGLSELAVFARH